MKHPSLAVLSHGQESGSSSDLFWLKDVKNGFDSKS